jgi:hypothetical protein
LNVVYESVGKILTMKINFILKFYFQPNSYYSQSLEVRVGTVDTPAGLTANVRCGDVKTNYFQKSELLFECQKPGLWGNIVSLMNLANYLYVIEIEIFG